MRCRKCARPPRTSTVCVAKSLTSGSSSKNADDIVITLAIRTPLTKARKGGFKDTSLEYLVYALLKEVRERSNLDPAVVEDICLGNVRNSVRRRIDVYLPSSG